MQNYIVVFCGSIKKSWLYIFTGILNISDSPDTSSPSRAKGYMSESSTTYYDSETSGSVPPTPVKRIRLKWTNEQTQRIEKNFRDFINNRSNYPNAQAIDFFFKKNPDILGEFNISDKKAKLRVKLNNCKLMKQGKRSTQIKKLVSFK